MYCVNLSKGLPLIASICFRCNVVCCCGKNVLLAMKLHAWTRPQAFGIVLCVIINGTFEFEYTKTGTLATSNIFFPNT